MSNKRLIASGTGTMGLCQLGLCEDSVEAVVGHCNEMASMHCGKIKDLTNDLDEAHDILKMLKQEGLFVEEEVEAWILARVPHETPAEKTVILVEDGVSVLIIEEQEHAILDSVPPLACISVQARRYPLVNVRLLANSTHLLVGPSSGHIRPWKIVMNGDRWYGQRDRLILRIRRRPE